MKCGVFLLNLVSAEDDSVSRKQDHRYHRGNPFILFFEFVSSSGGDARRGDDQSLNPLHTIIPLNFWHFFWALFLCMQGLKTSVFIGFFNDRQGI